VSNEYPDAAPPYIGEHFGWSVSFLVAAVLCAGGAAAWFFINPEYGEMRPEELVPHAVAEG
jgi:predicted MFS family arabinose efflux permease